MENELPKRGGAHTFEQLEAEVRNQQSANRLAQSGADMTAAREPAPPKGGEKDSGK